MVARALSRPRVHVVAAGKQARQLCAQSASAPTQDSLSLSRRTNRARTKRYVGGRNLNWKWAITRHASSHAFTVSSRRRRRDTKDAKRIKKRERVLNMRDRYDFSRSLCTDFDVIQRTAHMPHPHPGLLSYPFSAVHNQTDNRLESFGSSPPQADIALFTSEALRQRDAREPRRESDEIWRQREWIPRADASSSRALSPGSANEAWIMHAIVVDEASGSRSAAVC